MLPAILKSNEWERGKNEGHWPSLLSALDGTGSMRSDALKDVLLHCPGKSAAELHWHCLVKFIWNNGDLELLSHICVPAREGTIGFYMGAVIYTSIVVYNLWSNGTLGISSSGKLLQFECHNSKVDWNFVTSHFYYSFMSLFLFERGEERLTFIIGISTRPLLSLVKQSPLLHSTTTSSSTTNQWNK